MKTVNFEYNREIDTLYIYNDKIDEDVKGSITFDNLVFDVSAFGNIVGLEIDNASRFFGVDSEMLCNAKSARIVIRQDKQMLLLGFSILLETKENKVLEKNYEYLIARNKISLKC